MDSDDDDDDEDKPKPPKKRVFASDSEDEEEKEKKSGDAEMKDADDQVRPSSRMPQPQIKSKQLARLHVCSGSGTWSRSVRFRAVTLSLCDVEE